MAYTFENCQDNKTCVNLRKGLSAIASRQTGSIVLKNKQNSAIANDVAAPKEISASTCTAKSFLSL